ncbi:MAG: sigma D regulator [Gammaproteobacteria bacterium]|nr:sigma D regulator [Gammaproteobacteria bacterium]
MEVQETVERRSSSIDKLQTLLQTRTETLALLNQLAAMRPFNPEEGVQALLQEFCESLVDYTASSHFQLYRFIEEGTERRAVVKEIAAKVYPRISSTTRFILDFNEKYEADKPGDLQSLDRDLSQLGEVLADRITEEDEIIDVLTQSRG